MKKNIEQLKKVLNLAYKAIDALIDLNDADFQDVSDAIAKVRNIQSDIEIQIQEKENSRYDMQNLLMKGNYYLDKIKNYNGDGWFYRISYGEFTKGSYDTLEEAVINFNNLIHNKK